jgi:hypothetical protein
MPQSISPAQPPAGRLTNVSSPSNRPSSARHALRQELTLENHLPVKFHELLVGPQFRTTGQQQTAITIYQLMHSVRNKIFH